MNGFKKILSLLVCGVMLCALAACNDNDNNPNANRQWEKDKENHWTVSANGSRENVSSHAFDINGFCTICGTFMTMEKDGSINLQSFNEKGDVTSWIKYDPSGEKEADRRYEYDYSITGEKEELKLYNNGKLELEAAYKKDKNGEEYVSKQTSYNENGTKFYAESNEKADTVLEIFYDTEGEVEIENRYEYEYDENDFPIALKIYENDKLSQESTYAYDANGETYIAKQIDYWLDGSTTTIEYDETGAILSEVYYDALADTTEPIE
ncbi:MAG: hypothetical protein IJO76_07295 [Clostridia bacterium]|nr:hypothetical protein [Clostridia bacterium]